MEMDKEKEALSKISELDEVIRVVERVRKKAVLELIEAKQQAALENLKKYPQHAEMIVGELINVVNAVVSSLN